MPNVQFRDPARQVPGFVPAHAGARSKMSNEQSGAFTHDSRDQLSRHQRRRASRERETNRRDAYDNQQANTAVPGMFSNQPRHVPSPGQQGLGRNDLATPRNQTMQE